MNLQKDVFLPFPNLIYLVMCHDPESPFLPQSGGLVFCVFSFPLSNWNLRICKRPAMGKFVCWGQGSQDGRAGLSPGHRQSTFSAPPAAPAFRYTPLTKSEVERTGISLSQPDLSSDPDSATCSDLSFHMSEVGSVCLTRKVVRIHCGNSGVPHQS